jgi:hypothetical protein
MRLLAVHSMVATAGYAVTGLFGAGMSGSLELYLAKPIRFNTLWLAAVVNRPDLEKNLTASWYCE